MNEPLVNAVVDNSLAWELVGEHRTCACLFLRSSRRLEVGRIELYHVLEIGTASLNMSRTWSRQIGKSSNTMPSKGAV